MYLIKIFVVSLLMTSALLIDTQNYQSRRLYYSENDNVCRFGWASDQMNLTITFSDKQQLNSRLRGATGCDTTQHFDRFQIQPGHYTCFLQENSASYDIICFNQTTSYHRYIDLLLGVDQNVTVHNPASFDNNSY